MAGNTDILVTLGLDQLNEGFGIFDEDLRLVSCNRLYRKLRNYPGELCQPGTSLETMIRFNAERGDFGAGDPERQVAERMAEITKSDHRDIEREMADGQILKIRYQHLGGHGLIVTFEDKTKERHAQITLAASEERYALVSEAAEEAIYEWNIKTGQFFSSPQLAALLGLEVNKQGFRNWRWENRIHPEDIEQYRATLLAHRSGDLPRWNCEYRIKNHEGAYRWVSDHGTSVRNEKGEAIRMIAAVRDITDSVERDAALAANEERLTLVAQATSDGLYDWDVSSDLLHVSDRLNELFAFDDENLKSQRWADRVLRDDYPQYMKAVRAHFKGETDHMECEYRIIGKHGDYRWVSDHGIGVRDDNGRVVRLVGAVRDVTDIKQAEQASEAAHTRFNDAIEALSSGFVLFDADDRIVVCNTKYREYFPQLVDMVTPGIPFVDIVQAAMERGLFPESHDDPELWLAALLKKRAMANSTREQHMQSGLWLQISDHRTKDGGIVSIYTDVTELKIREAELQEQSAILEATLENMDQAISMVDKELNVVMFNRKFLEYMDFPETDFKRGFHMSRAFRFNAERGEYGEGDIDEQISDRLELAAKFEPHRFERATSDGVTLEIVGNPVEAGGFVTTYSDISERKKAEQTLRDREVELSAALQEFNAVLDAIDYGIIFMGPDLKAHIINRAFGKMWGVSQKFIDGSPTMRELIEYNRNTGIYDVLPEDWDDWVSARVDAVKRGGIEPTSLRRADGTVLQFQCIALPDGGRMLTYFDITELKRAEQVAHESEARLRGILERSPIGVAVIRDSDNIIVFHNARFPEVLRGPGENLVGTSSERFWTDMKEREQAREKFRKDGRVTNREVMYSGMDGSDVWSLSSYESADWEGAPARLIWLFDVTEEKANREALVVARDKAEAALSELQKAQDRLVQAEKMASLGQLTAGIAHEIKNPLNFINNFAKLSTELLGELADILKDPIASLSEDDRDEAEDLFDTVTGNLNKINEHGRRADGIVKNMLLHSREGPSEKQSSDLNAIAEEALNLAYHGARAENSDFNIEMVKSLANGVGKIDCFPQDLMRVFLNLISNGMYAANKKKASTVGPQMAPEPIISVETREQGENVVVEIRDNGTGIPEEIREKIFTPFFTTKPAGEGTGLGLSLSYDIVVKQHGGTLTIDSEPGEFTAFIVTLPRVIAEVTSRGKTET